MIEATDGGAHVTVDLAGGRYVEEPTSPPRGAAGASCWSARWRRDRSDTCRSTWSWASGSRSSAPCSARDAQEKAAATDGFVRDVVPLLADGRIAPVVETVIPLDRAADAYDLVASDTTFGKVILDCRSGADPEARTL